LVRKGDLRSALEILKKLCKFLLPTSAEFYHMGHVYEILQWTFGDGTLCIGACPR
jgi:hypothetical protein